MVDDVANISYNLPLGTGSRLPARDKNQMDQVEKTAIPGIMVLNFVSSIGSSGTTESTAVNIAAKNIYS